MWVYVVQHRKLRVIRLFHFPFFPIFFRLHIFLPLSYSSTQTLKSLMRFSFCMCVHWTAESKFVQPRIKVWVFPSSWPYSHFITFNSENVPRLPFTIRSTWSCLSTCSNFYTIVCRTIQLRICYSKLTTIAASFFLSLFYFSQHFRTNERLLSTKRNEFWIKFADF